MLTCLPACSPARPSSSALHCGLPARLPPSALGPSVERGSSAGRRPRPAQGAAAAAAPAASARRLRLLLLRRRLRLRRLLRSGTAPPAAVAAANASSGGGGEAAAASVAPEPWTISPPLARSFRPCAWASLRPRRSQSRPALLNRRAGRRRACALPPRDQRACVARRMRLTVFPYGAPAQAPSRLPRCVKAGASARR